MMTIHQFAEDIATRKAEWLPKDLKDCDVTVRSVEKPGNQTLTGLTWHNTDSNCSPVFYLNEAYNSYSQGEMTIDQIIKSVAQTVAATPALPLDIDEIADWNKAKKKIVTRIINTVTNSGYIKDRVQVPIDGTDCSIIFDLVVDHVSGGRIPVTKYLREQWGVSTEDIHDTATKSSPQIEPPIVRSLSGILHEMCAEASVPEISGDDGSPMLIVTNEHKILGASAILCPGVADHITEMFDGEAYYLPSSVHELICVPQAFANPADLLAMVTEINRTQVSGEDFLADDVWEMKSGAIVSAVKGET